MWDQVVLNTKDWSATLLIGFLVASWWRGTWVLFDIYLCDQPDSAGITTGDSFCFVGILEDFYIGQHRDTGWHSLVIGFAATFIGVAMMWIGMWRPQVVDVKDKVTLSNTSVVLRLVIVYVLGLAAVNVWRGVWYLTDYYLWPDEKLATNQWGEWPLGSFWFSSVMGSTVCFLLAAGPSILAPPGIFLIDGPGVNPPYVHLLCCCCCPILCQFRCDSTTTSKINIDD